MSSMLSVQRPLPVQPLERNSQLLVDPFILELSLKAEHFLVRKSLEHCRVLAVVTGKGLAHQSRVKDCEVGQNFELSLH